MVLLEIVLTSVVCSYLVILATAWKHYSPFQKKVMHWSFGIGMAGLLALSVAFPIKDQKSYRWVPKAETHVYEGTTRVTTTVKVCLEMDRKYRDKMFVLNLIDGGLFTTLDEREVDASFCKKETFDNGSNHKL